MKTFIQKVGNFLYMSVFCAIVFLVIFGFIYVKYWWTKNSLEDIAGKEVSPSTVIWVMNKK